MYYYVAVRVQLRKKKAAAEAFLAAHPDAAKVFTKMGLWGLYGELTAIGVDDQPPTEFYEGLMAGQGFLLLPGGHVVEATYAWTRPGILHKTVTTRIGPSKLEVVAEPGKRYRLSFNRREEQYRFEELAV